MSMFCQDRDLLSSEPVLFIGGGFVGQELTSGSDGAISSTTFTSAGSNFTSAGVAAGMASQIPEVIAYAEEHDWETDFYMGCFYNLARGYKLAPAVDQDAYHRDRYPASDPGRMTAVLAQVPKPCIGYKILAAGRRCADEQMLEEAFRYAFNRLKPTDAVVVGMYQKHSNQVAQNAALVRRILGA